MKQKFKAKIIALAAIIIVFSAVIWFAGTALSHSTNRKIGNLPPDLQGRNVEFPSASGSTIHGWWIAGQPHKGAIILMHVGIDSRDGPALPAVLAGLRERGYSFVGLTDLLAR